MSSTDRWVTLGPLAEVAVGGAVHVELPGGRSLAVFRTAPEDVRVLDGRCPHQAARLADGAVAGGSVTCADHGWQYDLVTGERLDRVGAPVRCHRARVVDGTVAVALERVRS